MRLRSLVMAGMLVLVACGSVDDAGSAPTAPPTTAAVPVTTQPATGESAPPTTTEAGESTPTGVDSPTASVDSEVTVPPAISELDRDPVGGGGHPEGTVVELFSFTSPTVMGADLDVSSLLGRDVVLWFWAPWCSWCNAEAPRVSAAAADFEGQVEILGVAGVSNIENMRSFVERHGLEHLDHVADVDGSVWLDFDVTYQPWWIFVNDDGTVIENWQGRLSDEGIRERIEMLIEL